MGLVGRLGTVGEIPGEGLERRCASDGLAHLCDERHLFLDRVHEHHEELFRLLFGTLHRDADRHRHQSEVMSGNGRCALQLLCPR
jgi:hypothetical protein